MCADARARPGHGSSRKGGGLVDAPDARIVRKKGKYPLRAAYRPGIPDPSGMELVYVRWCRAPATKPKPFDYQVLGELLKVF